MSFYSSTFAEANATLQQQLGEGNTALRAKEADCSKLAEERDRLVSGGWCDICQGMAYHCGSQ